MSLEEVEADVEVRSLISDNIVRTADGMQSSRSARQERDVVLEGSIRLMTKELQIVEMLLKWKRLPKRPRELCFQQTLFPKRLL